MVILKTKDMKTKLTELLGIEHPIIVGGMVWCNGHKLASAVSLAGGLGLIGAGSMHPETIEEHIIKCKAATEKAGVPYGVNLPLFYPEKERAIEIILKHKVPIVVTAGGSPALYTKILKEAGVTVMHVVASTKFAQKAAEAGVDAVICEGFEAGGHNGRDETTTMVLTPLVVGAVDIPVVAAGGIATGGQMAAALALGAEGVQIGSRFALCAESSAHPDFKKRCLNLPEGETTLTLKELSPIRLVKNEFYDQVQALYEKGATKEELAECLGRGRSKRGLFEGDLKEGEVIIGQVASLVTKEMSAKEIIDEVISECKTVIENLANLR